VVAVLQEVVKTLWLALVTRAQMDLVAEAVVETAAAQVA
jgi:hypothetical protein